jgi:hypothetical protein
VLGLQKCFDGGVELIPPMTLVPPTYITCDDHQHNGSNASWYPENTCESDGLSGVRRDIEKVVTIHPVVDGDLAEAIPIDAKNLQKSPIVVGALFLILLTISVTSPCGLSSSIKDLLSLLASLTGLSSMIVPKGNQETCWVQAKGVKKSNNQIVPRQIWKMKYMRKFNVLQAIPTVGV